MKGKKEAKSDQARTSTISVRLDPRLRYLAELAARRQRRTLSSFVEWTIEETLDHVSLNDSGSETVGGMGNILWETDESERFALLAFRYPHLLNHEEQVRWKLIRENGAVWRGTYKNDEWTWDTTVFSQLNRTKLRDHWETFKAVASGNKSLDALPKWSKLKSTPKDDWPI